MDEINSGSAVPKANQRLRQANTGITIIQRGSKLSLRGMLPKKQGEGKAQQTLALLDHGTNSSEGV